MRWLKSVSNRLRSLFRKSAVEQETVQELQFHLERQIATGIAAGLSPEEARRTGLLDFGGVEQFKEECREARGVNRIESLLADLRYGFRTLRKSPGFAIVSVLTLAPGIGANSAIFSMVNALLLRPYNFRNLDSLIRVWEDRGIDEGYDARYIAPADAEDLHSTNGIFEGMTTYSFQSFGLGTEGDVQPILGCRVSANFFDVLAVSPAAGRLFTATEEQPGADQVAILSFGSWQRRFGGDPQVLGKTISLNGRVYTIVAIMPKDFDYPVPVESWVPLALTPAEKADRSQLSLNALARLKTGVSLSQARAELASFSHRLELEYPMTNAGRATTLLQLRKELYMFTLPLFLLLQAAAGFVLLLACANLANLVFCADDRPSERNCFARRPWRGSRTPGTTLLVGSVSVFDCCGCCCDRHFVRQCSRAAHQHPRKLDQVGARLGWDSRRRQRSGLYDIGYARCGNFSGPGDHSPHQPCGA